MAGGIGHREAPSGARRRGAASSSVRGPLVRTVVDADGYRSSIKGVTVDTIRTGSGGRPNRVVSRQGHRTALTAISIGYPIVSHARVPSDRIVVATIEESPGGRWVGMDLEPGLTFVYGPEVEHVAVNPQGTRFRFAAVDTDVVRAAAESIGVGFDLADRPGRVMTMVKNSNARAVSSSLRSAQSAADGDAVTLESNLVATLAKVSAPPTTLIPLPVGRRIDDRYVTSRCIEFAESVGRMPSIVEMCEAAHVSERRLRLAFTAVYDMPPTQFFRIWALSKADHRLRSTEHHPGMVSRIAIDLGLSHLGRFSARYRAVYGVSPSEVAGVPRP